MKKFFKSLPFKLLISIVIGIIIGLNVGEGFMNVINPIKYVLGQVINFIVPLLIIACIAPSIVTLGQSASRMLGIAILIAYCSSVLAALASTAVGFNLIPKLNIPDTLADLRELGDPIFQLDIPAVMPVMSALVFAIFIGLAVAWTKSETWAKLLGEFQNIILTIVNRIIIPILPAFIMTTFMSLAWQGVLTKQLPVFLKIVILVLVGHWIWMAILYSIAGSYAKVNPWKGVFKNYGPAYITAVGTMSSAATLPVALRCARKSTPPLREDMVNFGIPLFSNIHLCGSVLTETLFVMVISVILYGKMPTVGNMLLFCFLLGIFAIGAPGVPGGTVMASLGLITGVLGFDANGAGMVIAIFALQDSFGTACNVTSDGALTLFLSAYADKHHIEEAESVEDLAK